MTSSHLADVQESWSLLGENDLAAVNRLLCSPKFQGISDLMLCYLASRLCAELRHRRELCTLPALAEPWATDACDNEALYRLFLASLCLRRACSHSETLQQWASCIHDAICSSMGQRLLNRIAGAVR